MAAHTSNPRILQDSHLRGSGSPTNGEKLPKIALIVDIGPFSGALRLAQTRTNAPIFDDFGERDANAGLAAGAMWI
jgi:hypothetical protein